MKWHFRLKGIQGYSKVYNPKERETQLPAEFAEKDAVRKLAVKAEEREMATEAADKKVAAKTKERNEGHQIEFEMEKIRLAVRPEVVIENGIYDNVRRSLDQRLMQLNTPIFNHIEDSINVYLSS